MFLVLETLSLCFAVSEQCIAVINFKFAFFQCSIQESLFETNEVWRTWAKTLQYVQAEMIAHWDLSSSQFHLKNVYSLLNRIKGWPGTDAAQGWWRQRWGWCCSLTSSLWSGLEMGNPVRSNQTVWLAHANVNTETFHFTVLHVQTNAFILCFSLTVLLSPGCSTPNTPLLHTLTMVVDMLYIFSEFRWHIPSLGCTIPARRPSRATWVFASEVKIKRWEAPGRQPICSWIHQTTWQGKERWLISTVIWIASSSSFGHPDILESIYV